MTISIDGSNGLSLAGQFNSASTFGMKNRIINGDFRIDQRNAGASYTQPVNQGYSLDRWFTEGGVTSKYTVQQNAGSVTPPAGFVKYLGVTSLSAYTIGAGDNYTIGQMIEGLNVADLGWGTANAATVTLSFWVRSSLTGTFGGSLANQITLNTPTRSYPFSFTISSANTWTYVSITIAGDTTGTWGNTNGAGICINFSMGSGTNYQGTAGAWVAGNKTSVTGEQQIVANNASTFYITGVQLEKGSTATSFDYRPYGTELALCQRYYEAGQFYATTYSNGSNDDVLGLNFKVTKRTAPSVSIAAYTAVYSQFLNGGTVVVSTSTSTIDSVALAVFGSTSGLIRVCQTWNASAEL